MQEIFLTFQPRSRGTGVGNQRQFFAYRKKTFFITAVGHKFMHFSTIFKMKATFSSISFSINRATAEN